MPAAWEAGIPRRGKKVGLPPPGETISHAAEQDFANFKPNSTVGPPVPVAQPGSLLCPPACSRPVIPQAEPVRKVRDVSRGQEAGMGSGEIPREERAGGEIFHPARVSEGLNTGLAAPQPRSWLEPARRSAGKLQVAQKAGGYPGTGFQKSAQVWLPGVKPHMALRKSVPR